MTKPPESKDASAADTDEVRVPFERLSEGHNEVIIEYEGKKYRLRATRNGKLILGK